MINGHINEGGISITGYTNEDISVKGHIGGEGEGGGAASRSEDISVKKHMNEGVISVKGHG